MSDTLQEHAIELPTAGGVLAATLHAPPKPGRTLLIVPPLAEERKACQRLLCELARRLAADGCTVLRFDPRGCGDSPGDFADFSVPDWQDDIAAAAAWLQARHPRLPRHMLGLRFGAQLALQSDVPREGLILVEPVSGPDFLRQLQQRNLVNQMVAYGSAPRGRTAMTAAWRSGESVDLDGFVISARLWSDLQAATGAAVGHAPAPAAALIVTTGADTTAADRCQRLLPAADRIALHLPAFWNTVGQVDVGDCLQAVVTWLHGRDASPPQDGLADAGRADVQTAGAAPDNGSCGRFAAGSEQAVAFLAPAGGVVRGVVHVPAARAAAHAPRRIVFLPGWSGDRTGPHRMFVHAARQLAAAGHTCLRFDYRGRGDSDGRAVDATIASMADDAAAALAWLRTRFPNGGPFVLVAICSGCKVAITTAAQAADVAELVLWSAESMGSLRAPDTNRRKTGHVLRAYARKLLQPATWRKLLRGQVRADMVCKALVRHETRSAAEAQREDETLRVFRAFRGRLFFAFGGSDPDAPGSSAAYRAYCARHGIAQVSLTVPHAGHSYYAADWERQVLEATMAFIETR